jgi:L-asparagine transporter-like permease
VIAHAQMRRTDARSTRSAIPISTAWNVIVVLFAGVVLAILAHDPMSRVPVAAGAIFLIVLGMVANRSRPASLASLQG